jgi:hypothetical protein
MPPEGLNPAVGMHSEGEEVRLNLDARWDDVVLMSIDSCEEDWLRLHDIRINGQVNSFKVIDLHTNCELYFAMQVMVA